MSKRYTIALLLLLTCFNSLLAQPAPSEIRMVLPEKGIYRFSSFNDGTIVFRNGIVSAGRLNYNVSLDEIHFIGSHGDTLSLADPLTTSFISLNGSRFYYEKGYLQTIDSATTDGFVLAYRQILSMQEKRALGAYGMTVQHEGVHRVPLYNSHGQAYQLDNNKEVLVTAKEIFFFGDAYGHFYKASRQVILDHFSKQQDAIKEFIKANHINFNTYKDLELLMSFCRGLKQ